MMMMVMVVQSLTMFLCGMLLMIVMQWRWKGVNNDNNNKSPLWIPVIGLP